MHRLLFISLKINLVRQVKTFKNYELESSHTFSRKRRYPFKNADEIKSKRFCSKGVKDVQVQTDCLTVYNSGEYINETNEMEVNEEYSNQSLSLRTHDTQQTPANQNYDYSVAPPFNLIYNTNHYTCWIITIIHNIRANPALQKYLLNNCTSICLKLGLKTLLNIDKRDINELEHYSVTHLYTNGAEAWDKCGFEISLLNSFFNNIDFNLPPTCNISNNYSKSLLERIQVSSIQNYEINMYEGIPNLPLIFIQPKAFFPDNEYFSISEPFINRFSNSKNLNGTYQYPIYFNYKPEFLIINLNVYSDSHNNSRLIKGISLDKDIYIPIKGEYLNQKYSLTGISLRIHSQFNHCNAIIKVNNKWYDTDYETNKYFYKGRKSTLVEPKNLVRELNSYKGTINVDHNISNNNLEVVYILFYQKA